MTAEEKEKVRAKAKEYAQKNTIPEAGYILNLRNGYLAGYTDAISSLSQYKEAIREACRLITPIAEYEVGVKKYVEFVDKAKQLIKEE